jgi:hypothetical protein
MVDSSGYFVAHQIITAIAKTAAVIQVDLNGPFSITPQPSGRPAEQARSSLE